MAAHSDITAAEKKQRGQFFTTHPDVQQVMLALVEHHTGRALEPSAGAGHLVLPLETRPGLTVDAIELDDRIDQVCATTVTHADFFAFAADKDDTYQVVFGNPPYVAWREVEGSTRVSAADVKSRYPDKANLYYLFIDRCADLLADGGEMVLIVPKEWLYTTTAKPLRTKLAAAGAITDLVDCGEEKLFADADVPALLIFRWVKGAAQADVRYFDRFAAAREGTATLRTLRTQAGRWIVLDATLADQVTGWSRLGDQYSVKVGMVTGCDAVFRLPADHTIEPDCVRLHVTTKRTTEAFLDANHITSADQLPPNAAAYLAAHKETLMARRIATFTEDNWWRYGAIRNEAAMASDTDRIYALAKTRSATPFFTLADATYYGGGVLGLFPRTDVAVSRDVAVAVLNSPRFRRLLEAMFLTSNDKVSLQPATLEDVPFPCDDAAALAWLAGPDAHADPADAAA